MILAPYNRGHPIRLLVLLALLPVGCARIPSMPVSAPTTQIQQAELRAHVDIFSDPHLKGRRCRTSESRAVRRYIRDYFEQIGLAPWGDSRGLDQSFSLGTNVVGVLPGRDPSLADEIILVSAPYDGPGSRKGNILPDAAGSSAPIAALLDIAQQLANDPAPLGRTVAFAAFDCGREAYLGAFAFTARDDFDPARIAAVVHLGMMGRPLFGVVENTVVALGAADSESLAAAAGALRDATGLRAVPLGSDLAGPVGDYFAFQQWPIPCLLLTNGLYSDFHKPSDTPSKIDFDLLERTANGTAATIRDLANQPAVARVPASRPAGRDELAGIRAVLEQLRAGAAANDLTPGEVQMLDHLIAQAGQYLASPTYSPTDRSRLLAEMMAQGAPSAVRFLYDRPKPPPSKVLNPNQVAELLRFQAFFATHSPFAARAMQEVVRYFTEGWTLFRLFRPFNYSACDITDSEIIYDDHPSGRRLSLLYPRLTIRAGLSERKMDVKWFAVDLAGRPDEIVDYCLLIWSNEQDGCLDQVMPPVLHTITSRQQATSLDDWLTWHMEQMGLSNEDEWLATLWSSDHPLLLKALLKRAAADRHVSPPADALVRIITDSRIRPDVRADAIRALPADPGTNALEALVQVLSDTSPTHQPQDLPAFDPTFPFHDHVIMQLARKDADPRVQETIGQLALHRLTDLTGQTLGDNPENWKTWIDTRRR